MFLFLPLTCNLLMGFGHLKNQPSLPVFVYWPGAGEDPAAGSRTSQTFSDLLLPPGVYMWFCSSNMLPASVFSGFQTLVSVLSGVQIRQDRNKSSMWLPNKLECWIHGVHFCFHPERVPWCDGFLPGCSTLYCIREE